MPLAPSQVEASLTEALLCARYGEISELHAIADWAEVVKFPCPFSGNTCLMLAAANNHKDVVISILGVIGNHTDARNSAGNSALHWAALNGHLEVAEMLLAAGASADAKNSFDRRPFDEALARGFGALCELLAKHTDFSNDPEFAGALNEQQHDLTEHKQHEELESDE